MNLIKQRGFTLIELMVVVVIIGILAALAIPKMMGVSAKSKASEAPTIIANYETLQSAYAQETGVLGGATNIGFNASQPKWWTMGTGTAGTITATVGGTNAVSSVGECLSSAGIILQSAYTVANDSAAHTKPNGAANCKAYFPNF